MDARMISPTRSAILGGIVWLAMLAVPAHGEVGLGSIERMFLFAPLVLMPLALTLAKRIDTSHGEHTMFAALQRAQPFASVPVAASFLIPQGTIAALLVLPWTLFTLVGGLCGLMRIRRDRISSAQQSCFNSALMMLPVGGIGLIQSRFGATPLGFHEPWVLLVAVHFHYAAFIAPILVGALGQQRTASLAFNSAAAGVISGSPLMAIGFLVHLPVLRAAAASVLGVGLILQSILLLRTLSSIPGSWARLFLFLSAGSIAAGMVFAILFTLGDLHGEVWISIPQMARTHGLLNGFGFSLCGLIGWNLARRQEFHRVAGPASRRPQTLLSRWE